MNWSEFLKAEIVRTGTYGMKIREEFPERRETPNENDF
jgi:hypothetical protein